MNFLSHYYLHNDKNDNYFTVGLTVPDLFGFLSERIRISSKFLKNIYFQEDDNNIRFFISGMYVHILIDKWFHSSVFFRKNVLYIENFFFKFNNIELYNFYSHIILEILIDRFLLLNFPNIADNFYESYKKFDFKEVLRLFTGFKNFDSQKFYSFAVGVANSSFLKEYVHDDLIISILKRVSNRINMPFLLKIEDEPFAEFIGIIYKKLVPSICKLLSYARRNLILDKNKLFED